MTKVRRAMATAYIGYACRYLYLLILIPFYAHTLGPSAYGTVLAALSLSNFVWVIQNWGFSAVGARNIAHATTAEQRQHEFARNMSARLLLVPVALLVGVVAIALSPLLRGALLISLLAVASGILSGFNLGWYFQGRMQFRTSITCELIAFGVSLPLVLLLVREPEDGIWVVSALLAGGVAASLYAYAMARIEVSLAPSHWRDGVAMLKESASMFIAAGTSGLLANAGTYSLGTLSTPAQVAFYGTADRVVTTVLGMLAPAGQVMLSWFSGMQADGSTPEQVAQRRAKALKWVCGAGLLAAVGSCTIAPPILSAVLGAKFEPIEAVMLVFSPIFLLSAFNHGLVVYVLLPSRQDKRISYVGMACALFGCALMALTAGRWGAAGVAATRVATEALSACLLLLAFRAARQRPSLQTAPSA